MALGLVVLFSASVFAGTPEEDFAAGAKANAVGDFVAAMPLLKRAADKGLAPAQALYAEVLDAAEDDALAVTYFRKAADQNNADGQYGLGAMYLKGEGVAKDPVAARRWIKLAADQDHKLAVTAMANAFIAGTMSVTSEERQSEEALRWIRKAADLNSLQSIDALVQAYRNGGFGLAVNAAEANRWQAKANELRGIVPGSRKAKNRNKEVTK